jgi:hypothetical protein
MRKSLLVLTVAVVAALPAAVSAQGFGVAGRAGTMGIGAEAALGLNDMLVFRGGIGLMPLELDPTSFWDPGTNVNANLKLPETWYNVGVDLYLGGGGFRIGGGMLFKPDDPTITASLESTASINIGGTTYTGTDVAEVLGTLNSKDQAPYVLIGFGKHTSTGIGLFLDLGVAMLGEPEVTLEATSGNPAVINSNEFKSRLASEAASIESDVGTYLKFWPILNLGVRFGIG